MVELFKLFFVTKENIEVAGSACAKSHKYANILHFEGSNLDELQNFFKKKTELN